MRSSWNHSFVYQKIHTHSFTHFLARQSTSMISCVCQLVGIHSLTHIHSFTTIHSFMHINLFTYIHSFTSIHSFNYIHSFTYIILNQRGTNIGHQLILFSIVPLSKCFKFCQCKRKTQKRKRKTSEHEYYLLFNFCGMLQFEQGEPTKIHSNTSYGERGRNAKTA